MTERTSALNLIRKAGEQIVCEFLQCEGVWYVWASHNGETRGKSFKINASGKTLTGCIKSVYDDLMAHGPEWVRK